jgi:WD40 repeat protein
LTKKRRERGWGGGGGAAEGQGGIISCLATSPASGGLMAAGSYSRTTAIYHEATGEQIMTLQGQKGGVTQVQWSPDGNFLYTVGLLYKLRYSLKAPGFNP